MGGQNPDSRGHQQDLIKIRDENIDNLEQGALAVQIPVVPTPLKKNPLHSALPGFWSHIHSLDGGCRSDARLTS